MGSKIKEDERIEKAIRSLLKLPENRRCINCNSLGPQYVCSTFWTFVCINCSGIHREFTHRVKSISMAKFTPEEVSALRERGNKRAKQIYFKEWDYQRNGYPDCSNILKLRDFIKSVYVDKRFSNDKISHHKPAVIEDYRDNKKGNASFFSSKSLNSLDKSESSVGRSGNESLKFYFDEKNHKPQQHIARNPKSRGLPKSPIRFEIVDDRFRDDGSVKKYEGHRESRGNSKSLDLSSNKDTQSFPIVRHASELLGDNVPRLRVENVVKVEKKKDPVDHQMTASSSSDKIENLGSLMDDLPVSEPSDDSKRQSSSELPASVKRTEEPAPNSLEALLFGLDVPSVVSGPNNYELWSKTDISPTASVDNYPAANLRTEAVSRTSDIDPFSVTSSTISHTGSSSGQAYSVAADNLNTTDMALAIVPANNQVESSISPNGPSDTSMEQSILDISNSVYGVGSEYHHQDETQSSTRKALPEDLFTGGFSFASQQVHGQHYGMGYGMQYYQYPVTTGAFTYTAKPSNPFDISCDDTGPNQAQQFPSMAYGQGGGLTHMPAPRGYSDSSSPIANSVAVMASQSSFYTTALSPNSQSLASNLSPGAFMGQQLQVNDGFNTAENNFNATQTFHQVNNGYNPSANPNAYISRGNPFE